MLLCMNEESGDGQLGGGVWSVGSVGVATIEKRIGSVRSERESCRAMRTQEEGKKRGDVFELHYILYSLDMNEIHLMSIQPFSKRGDKTTATITHCKRNDIVLLERLTALHLHSRFIVGHDKTFLQGYV